MDLLLDTNQVAKGINIQLFTDIKAVFALGSKRIENIICAQSVLNMFDLSASETRQKNLWHDGIPVILHNISVLIVLTRITYHTLDAT